MHAFSDIAAAAYCPRQAYYRRRADDHDPPAEVADRRALAFAYDELVRSDDETLREVAIAVDPSTYRERLHAAADRLDCWDGLVDPPLRDVFLSGRECRGIAHKVLDADGPLPVLVSGGEPPETGVWEPDGVRATAAAKALAWETERRVERALVEYPAHAVFRTVRMTTHRRAAYRRAVDALASIDETDGDPPDRIRDRSKCAACDYREQCGVRTRSLRSLL